MSSEHQAARRNPSPQGDAGDALRWLVRGVVLMLVAALLAWGGWALWSPKTFPLRSVRIATPLVHVTQEEVRAVVVPFAANGFLRVDMEQLRAALQALPWVYHASLRRAWPDVLEVSLEEQVPVARWEGGGLVSAHGGLFRPAHDVEQPQLPLFAGPEETAPVIVERYNELRQMLAAGDITVSRIALTERRAWEVELGNGLKLSLGRSDAALRMQRLMKVYPHTIAPRLNEIERVDLRYTNGFAIRWRDGHLPA